MYNLYSTQFLDTIVKHCPYCTSRFKLVTTITNVLLSGCLIKGLFQNLSRLGFVRSFMLSILEESFNPNFNLICLSLKNTEFLSFHKI